MVCGLCSEFAMVVIRWLQASVHCLHHSQEVNTSSHMSHFTEEIPVEEGPWTPKSPSQVSCCKLPKTSLAPAPLRTSAFPSPIRLSRFTAGGTLAVRTEFKAARLSPLPRILGNCGLFCLARFSVHSSRVLSSYIAFDPQPENAKRNWFSWFVHPNYKHSHYFLFLVLANAKFFIIAPQAWELFKNTLKSNCRVCHEEEFLPNQC